jgi:hypothetical protein
MSLISPPALSTMHCHPLIPPLCPQANLQTYATLYARTTTASPAALNNFAYLPYGPFDTAQAFLDWYVPAIQHKDNVVWFAILVRGGGGKHDDPASTVEEEGERFSFAGSIAYLNAEPANASCEIGHVSVHLT